MKAKSCQAWTTAIISLIVAMACFVLAKGFPLAFWVGVFWLAISFVSMIEAIRCPIRCRVGGFGESRRD